MAVREYTGQETADLKDKLLTRMLDELGDINRREDAQLAEFDETGDLDALVKARNENALKRKIFDFVERTPIPPERIENLLTFWYPLDALYNGFLKANPEPLLAPFSEFVADFTPRHYEVTVESILRGALDRNIEYENEDGDYIKRIYAAADDRLSFDEIGKIQAYDNPREMFDHIMQSRSDDYRNLYDEPVSLDTLERLDLDEEETAFIWEHEQEADEFLNEHIYIEADYEHFLRQQINVNIMLATPSELNRDDLGAYGMYSREQREMEYQKGGLQALNVDTALFRIAAAYGKDEALARAFATGEGLVEGPDDDWLVHPDPFVNAWLEEMDSTTSDFGGFTALLKMSVGDFITLKEMLHQEDTAFIIPAGTYCGIFDSFGGSGGMFDSQTRLPTDLMIPTSMIYEVWADGCEQQAQHDFILRSVASTYGFVPSMWRDFRNSEADTPFAKGVQMETPARIEGKTYQPAPLPLARFQDLGFREVNTPKKSQSQDASL